MQVGRRPTRPQLVPMNIPLSLSQATCSSSHTLHTAHCTLQCTLHTKHCSCTSEKTHFTAKYTKNTTLQCGLLVADWESEATPVPICSVSTHNPQCAVCVVCDSRGTSAMWSPLLGNIVETEAIPLPLPVPCPGLLLSQQSCLQPDPPIDEQDFHRRCL